MEMENGKKTPIQQLQIFKGFSFFDDDGRNSYFHQSVVLNWVVWFKDNPQPDNPCPDIIHQNKLIIKKTPTFYALVILVWW